jgi:hypothetical protein
MTAMRRIADALREDDRRRMASLTAAERVAAALALGRRDVTAFRLAAGLDERDAIRHLERRRQVGRRASRSHADVIG